MIKQEDNDIKTKKQDKSKSQIKNIIKKSIIFILFLIICSAIGFFLGIYAAKTIPDLSFKFTKVTLIKSLLFLGFYFVFLFVHIIIHELGHLIFGLFTGYKFVSFRIGKYLIKKEKDKLIIKRFKLPGTAGQCLMIPPYIKDGKLPYVLYNLGGSLLNVLTAAIFAILAIVFINKQILTMWTITAAIFSFSGFLIGMLNIIPLNMGIPNDGYNALSIWRDNSKNSLKSMYYQLVIHGQISEGIEVKELDIEEFRLDEKVDLVNPLNTSILFFEHYYYLAKHDYDKAKKVLEKLIPYEDEISTIFKNELNTERTFLELIGDCDKELIDRLFNKKLKKAVSASVLLLDKQRVMVAYEAFYNDDIEKSMEIYNNMKKNANQYPLKGAIDLELFLAQEVIDKYNDKLLQKATRIS